MSFTDKENNVIKEKLMDVQTPPVDAAWSRMSEMLESAPVQTGFLYKLGKGYKIFLNLFIGALLLSVAVFLHSAVQKNNAVHKLPVSNSSAENPIFASMLSGNHVPYVSELPSFKPVKQEINEDVNSVDNLVSIPRTVKMEADDFEYVKAEKLIVSEVLEPIPTLFEEEVFVQGNGLERERWDEDYAFSRSNWGVKVGYQIMTDVKGDGFASRFSAGVFNRHFISPQTAIQYELLYNPTVFRPITYVEKWQANSMYITDSAQVNNSRYLSLPITLFFTNELFSVNVGGQYSRLIGVYGDKVLKTQTTPGTTEKEEVTYGKVTNKDAFKRNNLAFVTEVNCMPFRNRLSLGVKLQYSLSDLTKDKLGPNIHRFGAVQFQAAYVLNRAN